MSEQELEDDRPRRRELTCLASGSLIGAVLIAVGTVIGGLTSARIAPHLSLEEWNPQLHQHSYVGTNSPDDDIS